MHLSLFGQPLQTKGALLVKLHLTLKLLNRLPLTKTLLFKISLDIVEWGLSIAFPIFLKLTLLFNLLSILILSLYGKCFPILFFSPPLWAKQQHILYSF